MARTEQDRMRKTDDGYVDGFDVTVERVVGTVSLDGEGQFPPHVAAFMLIAEADEQGVFKYPMRDGRTCVVDVTWEGEAE
jgi:hypothetical protein